MRKKNIFLRLFSLLLAAALALVFPACADQPDARQAVEEAFAALQAEVAADPVRVAEVTPVRTEIDIGYYDEEDGPVFLDVCTIKYGSHQMRYTMDVIGSPDADGTYPLYIALHGGGGAPEESNNEQWFQMTEYYKGAVSNGIYVACRGIEDVWNTHFVDDSYPLYDRLIEDMILLKHADPNRVYLLGFSAGGDGVYAIAPRMADRFAAVNMSSGHPNGVSLLNAANLPFEIQVGIRDYYSEDAMRSVRAAEFEKTLTDYNLQYGFGYPHRILVHVPAGHNYLDSEDGAQTVVKDPAEFARRAVEENWLEKFLSVLARIDGSDDVATLSYTSGDPGLDEAMSALITETLGLEVTPSVNANAVAYVSSFTRNPVPEKLVWDLSTRAPARQYTGFYWLRADYSVNRGILTASFDKVSNTVSVTVSEDVNGDFDILLNPLLVDFSRPLTVQTPKGEWTFTPEADPALIRQSLEASGDPNLAYAALIRVGADGIPRSADAPADEKASDPSEMLSRMTTEQKIAQLLMPAFYYRRNEKDEQVGVQEIYPEMEAVLQKYGFGGVIFNLQNSQENEKALRLVDAVQKASGSVAGRPQLITCTDQEGGYVTRLGRGTMTPGSMALGAANDPAVTEAAARLIGEEVVAIGYSGTFGPVMDVNNNPSNPVIGIRSFSDDPETVVTLGTAFIRGLHESGSLSTLKHFPGHGDTDTDSHTGLPVVVKSYEQLKDFELVPFQAGIDAGADMIMTAHIVYPLIEKGTYISKETGEEIGLPATLSKTILTDILRGDMGFSGLIVTDAMNMDAIARHFDVLDAAKLAIEAGVDLILRPVDPFTPQDMAALEQYIRDVAVLADEGKISMEAVDASVLRVLTFKQKHGMLAPYDGGDIEDRVRKAASVVGSAEHHEQEFEIAKKAVTLLKNDNILPLNLQEDKTAVLVPLDNQLLSVEFAIDRLKEEGKIPAETDIPVYSIASLPAGDLVKVCQENRRIFAVHTAYSTAGMDPAQKAGSSSVLVDTILTLAHAAGNSVIVVSAQLPYDAARFPSADALAVCFGARGMSEDPREVGNGVSQYGPNLPAALYLLLGGGEISGTLPVNLPAMDSACKFTDEILYARGTGIRLSPPENPAE